MSGLVFALAFVVAACGSRTQDTAGGAPRLVSLMPSGTEVVAALGAADQLVGVDEYSKFPPSVEALPKVGSFMFPNLEAIIALRPTLVIVDDIHGKSATALAAAGIATVPCAMHALPDVKTALRTVGARIGRAAEAEKVVAEIEAALDAAAAKRPAKGPRVLAVIDREADGLGNLVAVGPGSWVDELLAVAGGANVLAASGVRYPKISLEEVLRAQPEVILDLSFTSQRSLAPWNTLDVPAVKQGRVVSLFLPYLTAPSPRVKEALDAISEAIKPR